MTILGKKQHDCECRRCGRPGKSQSPEWYLCGQCYYQCKAEGVTRQIERLQKRVERYEKERAEAEARSAAFVQRHGYRPPLAQAPTVRKGRQAAKVLP